MSTLHLQFVMDNLSDLRVREKLLRLCQYMAIGASTYLAPHNQARLEKISSDIGLARLVYRSFDELPKLRTTLATYNNRRHQCRGGMDSLMWLTSILGNVCDCLYYPSEKIAWLWPAHPKASYFKTLATKFWVLSLFCTILRTLLLIRQLSLTKKLPNNEERAKLYKQQVLTLIMSGADFKNGLSMLGTASSSKRQIGAFGTVSSMLGLYSVLKTKFLQQQEEKRKIAHARSILE
ncbi:Peroxisomal biogenesis factor 11 [Trinorchestia longiramus]|nr:Peroxisomal biogenesis factor 11 [Trinorchestia longiramus]